MADNRLRPKTTSLRDDQHKFLENHPEVNFSGLCRQALDKLMEQYENVDAMELVELGSDEADCHVVVVEECNLNRNVASAEQSQENMGEPIIASLKLRTNGEIEAQGKVDND